jgi:hypothetical protein
MASCRMRRQEELWVNRAAFALQNASRTKCQTMRNKCPALRGLRFESQTMRRGPCTCRPRASSQWPVSRCDDVTTHKLAYRHSKPVPTVRCTCGVPLRRRGIQRACSEEHPAPERECITIFDELHHLKMTRLGGKEEAAGAGVVVAHVVNHVGNFAEQEG